MNSQNKRIIKIASIGAIGIIVTLYVTYIWFLLSRFSHSVIIDQGTRQVKVEPVSQLIVCIGQYPAFLAWHCKQAVYLFHPAPAEVQTLNTEGGVGGVMAFLKETDERQRLLNHLLAKGVDINAPMTKGVETSGTVLHYAVLINDAQAARMLLSAGANPRIKDDNGRTPLEYAKARQALALQHHSDKDYSAIIALLEQAEKQLAWPSRDGS